MTAEETPLFATIDPNRAFIRSAIAYLQSRSDYGDDAANEVLREFFIQSNTQNTEWLADTVEKQLTFRDGLKGDKLNALAALREVYSFMREDVYDFFTDQRHPKSQELCDNLVKAENALNVLSAGYVNSEGLRGMVERIGQEAPGAQCAVMKAVSAAPMYETKDNVITLLRRSRKA